MSRLAKKPITLPPKVEVKLAGRKIDVKGPKGSVAMTLSEGVDFEQSEKTINVKATPKLKNYPNLGLDRSRLANALKGVTEGFEKKLELIGVGFKANLKGKLIDFSLGFSHPQALEIPQGLEVKIEKNVLIVISGVDKQLVGQFAATIRSLKPPEPYKGKGIRYTDEVVRKKAGKTAK